jgi:hypothetical protein
MEAEGEEEAQEKEKKHLLPVVIIMTFINQLWVSASEVQFTHCNSTKNITLK